MEHVYVLDPGLDPELFGGSVALPNGELFDIAEALRDGNGEIRTKDDRLAGILDIYIGVQIKERIEDAPTLPASGPPEGGYKKLLKADVEQLVAMRGTATDGDTKDDLIAGLEAQDTAAGITTPTDGNPSGDNVGGAGEEN